MAPSSAVLLFRIRWFLQGNLGFLFLERFTPPDEFGQGVYARFCTRDTIGHLKCQSLWARLNCYAQRIQLSFTRTESNYRHAVGHWTLEMDIGRDARHWALNIWRERRCQKIREAGGPG